jgi:4-hydroxybenzoate polyprenyltransferase
VLAYLRLYRLDAASIAFFSTVTGALLGGGAGLRETAAAVLVSGVSMNFVYSFNSYTDREEDALNKPKRPIPAGKATPRGALLYSMALLAASCLYPPFLTRDPAVLALLYLLPLLGVLYSARPFRLKDRPFLAPPTVSLGLTIPLAAGHGLTGDICAMAGFFAAMFVFSTGAVALKDVEDAAGDRARGGKNLYLIYGQRSLAAPAMGAVAAPLTGLVWGVPPFLLLWLASLAVFSLAWLLLRRRFARPLERLYHDIILIVQAHGFVLLVILLFFPGAAR